MDEDALICDLAETYHIFDYKALPVKLLATLSVGLRENSRIQMKLNNAKIPFDMIVSIAQFDALNWLRWSKTKDAEKGRNMPQSLLKTVMGESDADDNITVFDSAEEYERRRAEIIGGNGNADIR